MGWSADLAKAVWEHRGLDGPVPAWAIPDERELAAAMLEGCDENGMADEQFSLAYEASKRAHTLLADPEAQFVIAWSESKAPEIAVQRSQRPRLVDPTELHRLWLERDLAYRPLHPLGQLVQWWQENCAATPISQSRKPGVLPISVARVPPHHRRAGKIPTFTTASDPQYQLPGTGEHTSGIALPLHLYQLAISDGERRGQAAPLPLRLWVAAILGVGIKDRDCGRVEYRLTLRELLDGWLYPRAESNRGRPRPGEYMPRLEAAADVLMSSRARVEWEDPDTGKGGRRLVVQVLDMPRSGQLDDELRVVVDLPPGTQSGPRVSQRLGVIGLKSARQYRALLGLAYRWWEPGRTHAPKRERKRIVWLPKDEGHEPLTDAELVSLVFPGTEARRRTNSHRQQRYQARKAIDALAADGELRIVETPDGTLVLPPSPTDVADNGSRRC